jgi:hypothetical protein
MPLSNFYESSTDSMVYQCHPGRPAQMDSREVVHPLSIHSEEPDGQQAIVWT